MLTALNSMVRGAWLWSHLTAAMWRVVTGRFFCFQDSPDVVVRFVCIELSFCAGASEDIDSFIAEAKSEWCLRSARRKRAREAAACPA